MTTQSSAIGDASDETSQTLKDIITITPAADGEAGYTIYSLASQAEDTADSSKAQLPFALQCTNARSLPQDLLDRFLRKDLPVTLQEGNAIYVLVSTLSGTGLALLFFDKILHPILRAIGLLDTRYDVVRTQSEETVKEFARSTLFPGVAEGKKQTVLMLSGDGGIVDIINGLLENEQRPMNYIKPVLSQLALGTGNALFHSLHKTPLQSIHIQGLRTLLYGTPKPLPMFSAKFSNGSRILTNEGQTAIPIPHQRLYGAVVASYGLHATLVADSDTTEYRKHGDKRFGLVAKDLLFPENGSAPHSYKARLTLVEKDKAYSVVDREEHGYALMSLVSNLEKTFTISPASKPLDGQLRVVHFGPLSGKDAMEVMTAAYDGGKHVDMKDVVGYEAVDGVKIEYHEPGESWKWRRCCIDGLIVGVEEGGFMAIDTVPADDGAVCIVVD